MDEKLHELGVLFVHGIGEQERGQTLTIWADALANWLSGWLGHDSVRPSVVYLTGDSGRSGCAGAFGFVRDPARAR